MMERVANSHSDGGDFPSNGFVGQEKARTYPDLLHGRFCNSPFDKSF